MRAWKMRWTGVMGMTLLLALVAVSLPDARSLANTAPEDPTGDVNLEIRLPNDRGPGLANPGNGGGRSGGSRDASNPDDFSVNSPDIRMPDVKVEAVPEDGLSRLIARMQQLLLRILNPGR